MILNGTSYPPTGLLSKRPSSASSRISKSGYFSVEAEERCANHNGMGQMSAVARTKKPLDERAIDRLVVAQASDDTAWGRSVRARRKAASLSIPPALAARAAFLARLHRRSSVEAWLTHVIQERVELEEAAFANSRQELVKNGRT